VTLSGGSRRVIDGVSDRFPITRCTLASLV
jgi:hypothetical protein